NQILPQDVNARINHYSFPIGQNPMKITFNIFPLTDDVFGTSFFMELERVTNQISSVALVWFTTKTRNPFVLIPTLKTIVQQFVERKVDVTSEILRLCVEDVIRRNGLIDLNLKGIHLKSTPISKDLVYLAKFLDITRKFQLFSALG
ncbi:MAG TPA: hypothetical protein VJ044_10710, partial [Candidatus Hodarchaeales archaeon]|nr:hypothetical protein [Candidatus Hodarchaeales archaeon]